MSKVIKTSSESEPTDENLRKFLAYLDEPLQALTETAPLNTFLIHAYFGLEKAKRKVKPGMKANYNVHREMLFYAGMIDLLSHLDKTKGVGAAAQKWLKMMDQQLERRDRLVDDLLDTAKKSLHVAEEWQEQAMEDGPADKDFLHPANLAMRLQRPHKSN